jgi:hypothetical protein
MNQKRALAPDFSYRLGFADIAEIYGRSAERALDEGNFPIAAQLAAPGSEARGCALIMSGLLEEGLLLLDQLARRSERAELCRAFAHWSLDRENEAKAVLDRLPDAQRSPKVRQFRALLDRNDITVFLTGAILSVFPSHNRGSVMEPVHRYGPIVVKYVGSQMAENAYDYKLDDPLDEFLAALPAAERPDILFSLSPMWLLPRNFNKVDVPKAIWCHDTDVFLYRNVENFALYDVAICTSAQENLELGRSAGLYCATNMMLHPLATPFPEARVIHDKKIDVVFTGSAFSSFHTEKSRFMYLLSALGEDCRVKIVDGYLPEERYFGLLSESKFLPMVNRYGDSTSPRWRDTLTNGAGLLHPEGALFSEIPGCFAYRAESIAADIRAHVERFDAGTDPAYDLAATVAGVNARFAIYRVPREKLLERLLKFAVFLALVWRPANPAVPRPQRRLTWLTPPIDKAIFGERNVRDRISDLAARIRPEDLTDERDCNNAAHLFAQLALVFTDDAERANWVRSADRHFDDGFARFPRSLLLRFNRAWWLFLKPSGDPVAAASEFEGIIADFDRLEFDYRGSDIGFGYTLNERDLVFPYYEYGDLVTRKLLRASGARRVAPHRLDRSEPKDLLLSACHGYIGWSKLKSKKIDDAIACFGRALAIFPEQSPLLRTYVETLLYHSSKIRSDADVVASTLADALFAAANVDPSILLTHIFPALPILAEGDETGAARTLLESWYRLANIIEAIHPAERTALHPNNLMVLCHFRHLLPARLIAKIKVAEQGTAERASLTQLEALMVDADAAYRRKYPVQGRDLRKLYAGIVVEYVSIPSGVRRYQLKRAFLAWWRAPTPIKRIYLRKALIGFARGEFRGVMSRIREWGGTSAWARELE